MNRGEISTGSQSSGMIRALQSRIECCSKETTQLAAAANSEIKNNLI